MTTLVTGGAGYIGAHVVRLLVEQSGPESVLVADDLSTGVLDRITGVRHIDVDLTSSNACRILSAAMNLHGVDRVIHFAGKKQVGESVERPGWYYRQNLGSLNTLHEAMHQCGVRKLIFSSSAAVYGTPATVGSNLVAEDDPAFPISPYGETKLVGEWLNRAACRAWGLDGVNLRYFNVAGAADDKLGDRGAFNLIPMIFEQIGRGAPPLIFGGDYPTPDGTCIRDYIHVVDLAQAHLDALAYLDMDDRPYDVFNVGTGMGASVAEIVDAVGRAAGLDLKPTVVGRRAGDPASVVADPTRIGRALHWKPEYNIDDVVSSAWSAWVSLKGAPHLPPPSLGRSGNRAAPLTPRGSSTSQARSMP